MMKRYCVFGLIVFVLMGCAVLKQAKSDYELGKTAPYSTGETTVDDQTRALVNTVSGIPYANLSVPFIILLAPIVLRWVRGHDLRKNPTVPKSGNELVNVFNSVTTHLLEVAPDGSILKRGWKMTVIALLGVMVAPAIERFIPFLQANHPTWMNGVFLSAVIGLLASAEKFFQKVNAPQ